MLKKTTLIVQVDSKKKPTSNQGINEIYFRLSARSCILVYPTTDIRPNLRDAQSFLRNLVNQVLINDKAVNSCYGFLVEDYIGKTFWKANYYIVCHFKKKVSTRNRNNFNFLAGPRKEQRLANILNVESGLQTILSFNANPEKRIYSFSLKTSEANDWVWKPQGVCEEEAYWQKQKK